MATRPLSVVEKLAVFVKRWNDYHSLEIRGAQVFLQHLLDCYGALDYEPGEIFEQHPVKVQEQPVQTSLTLGDAPVNEIKLSSKRMDMYIPRICVWEMKGPGEDLNRHYQQVRKYWDVTRPRYMVLCNFHEFWIYDTDLTPQHDERDGLTQAYKLKLIDLTENPDALAFLAGGEAFFARRSAQVTRDAATYIGHVVRELIHQSDAPARDRERITKFALECVFAMFGEDTGIIPGKLFEQAIKKAQASGDLSHVYTLFDDFGRANDFDRDNKLAPYINGPLFDREHPKLPVNKTLLASLYEATAFDWTYVRPEIFGSIFEQALDPAERHALGAHFTSEEDIMKVVGPTIVRPWRERISACKTHKDCEALIERMKHYHVLDPACGSGNFLYIAYRELKLLEAALAAKWEEHYNHKVAKRAKDRRTAPAGPYFTIRQLHGIDKEEVAVQLTKVVLWIGQHTAARETDSPEPLLPLQDLSENIIKADALFTDWRSQVERAALISGAGAPPAGDSKVSGAGVPARDSAGTEARPTGGAADSVPPEIELAIVGNPPFMGRHKMRLEMGDDYVDKLHKAFPHNRNADYVTYWYTQALKFLKHGERAGFVSTNSIAQNESREASLDRIIAAGGTIHDAWKSYPWPGEAVVHVSIVNWITKAYEGSMFLQGTCISSISSYLSEMRNLSNAKRLQDNLSLCFEGVQPGNNQFVVSDEARLLILRNDPHSEEVIKPLLIGRDVAQEVGGKPSRWIVDFNQMTQDEAKSFQGAYNHLREVVYPARSSELERKPDSIKAKWWRFKRPAPDLRRAIEQLDQCIALVRVSPYLILVMVSTEIIPDSRLKIIALSTYYHFGVLQSAVHEYWAWARGATLKADLSYTNTTIFETFPFPLLDSSDPFNPSSTSAPACAGEDPESSTKVVGRASVPASKRRPETAAPLDGTEDSGRDAGTERMAGTEARPTSLNYNPRLVPDTPQASRVSAAAEELYTKRQAACRSFNLGLTKLYNLIKNKRGKKDPQDEGFDVISNLTPEQQELIRELRRLHEELNAAVCACYGWPEDTWRDENEVLTRLLTLNQQLTS